MLNRPGMETLAPGSSRAPALAAPRGAPGVGLTAPANDQAIRVAAAVAAGVAESLQLGLEASASLNAIAVEGARNVVAHAYPPGQIGPLWMQIVPPAATRKRNREVAISFRDVGRGCSIWPTADDPQGIGLALVSELSEGTKITSRRGAGTAIEASVSIDDGFEAHLSGEPPARPGESEIRFEGTELMDSVLPRALGAHVDGPGATMDQVEEASRLGEALAADLSSRRGTPPSIRVTDRPADPAAPLEVHVGPLDPGAASRLVSSVESAWRGDAEALCLGTEASADEGTLACIQLDLSRH